MENPTADAIMTDLAPNKSKDIYEKAWDDFKKFLTSETSSATLQDDGLKVAAHKVRVAAYKVDQYCPLLGERRTIKKKVRFK